MAARKTIVAVLLLVVALAVGCGGYHDEEVPRCDRTGFETTRHKHNTNDGYTTHFYRAHETDKYCAIEDNEGRIKLVEKQAYESLQEEAGSREAG